jgi:DUF4097 and DUF4098 domain-containing protein YvlB
MFFRNKWILLLALLLLVVGGITFMVNTVDVFGQKESKKVIKNPTFTNIEVEADNAEVEIVSTTDSEATVEYTGAGKRTKYNFDVDVKRDTLSVLLDEKRRFFFSFGFNSKGLKLTVSLPEEQYESMQVETDNGRISAEDINVDALVMETDNGQIHIKNVETGVANVESDNGKLILDHVEGEIIGRLNNGRISVWTDDFKWPMDLMTDNGSIEIKTGTKPTNVTIDAQTDNGRITIFGEKIDRATYGKGKHVIKLRTDNGSINVTK